MDDAETLARHFAALMDHVRGGSEIARAAQDQRLLIDQLRFALDRALDRLDGRPAPSLIADSFWQEGVVYCGVATEVWRLRHRDLASRHILKTLAPDHAGGASATERLLREGEIGLKLRHPSLLETSAVLHLADGRPGLLQPDAGSSLAALQRQQSLNASEIGAIAEGLLDALVAMHRLDYGHGDISAGNLLIADRSRLSTTPTPPAQARKADDVPVKLGDFGLALPLGETHASLGLRDAGTAATQAPEQAVDRPWTVSMDLYAAGRVLQSLLAALPSPAKQQVPETNDAPADALPRRTTLLAVADRLTKTDPGRRPSSAEDALHELRGEYPD